jgi:hypothetical protein
MRSRISIFPAPSSPYLLSLQKTITGTVAIMSINQTAQFLQPAPLPSDFPDQSPQYIYHLNYDQNDRWEEFRLDYPSAVSIGLGGLKNWTWHINVKGMISRGAPSYVLY